MRLRLGLRYALRTPAAERDAAEELYAQVLAHAERADALGADVLWVAERPFAPGFALPAALPLCAALAARTRRARIGTAVLPLPLYHPLRLAEDAATLDGLSGGRLELGLGLGADAEAFARFGVAWGERGARFEEALELLRRAWVAEPLGFGGRHASAAGLEVWPKPIQAGGPPIWIGARAGAAIARAAHLADGVITTSVECARAFLAAREATGRARDAARVALLLPLIVVDDPSALHFPLSPSGAFARAEGGAPGSGRLLVCDVEAAALRIRAALGALRDCPSLDVVLPAPVTELPREMQESSLELVCGRLRDALAAAAEVG